MKACAALAKLHPWHRRDLAAMLQTLKSMHNSGELVLTRAPPPSIFSGEGLFLEV
jgi:hypothetical protein